MLRFLFFMATYGEDGSFQGLLKCHNLPFVGSDVLSSAIAMDKVFTKKLLLNAHIPTAKFVEVSALKSSAYYYQKEQVLEQVKALGLLYLSSLQIWVHL